MPNTERKPRPQPSHEEIHEIEHVYTMDEVAAGWHKHYKTVKLAIDTGRLTARKAGRQWLISRRSVIRLWGNPLELASEIMYAHGD